MMDWKDLATDFAKMGAPLLGAALGGPVGAKIGAMVATALGSGNDPSAVKEALLTSPDAAVRLSEIESQLQMAQLAAAASQVESVNKTLQTEAMGGSFWQRNHHAFESSFALVLVSAIYFVLPLAHIPVPAVDPEVWMMIGAILGVTAWQRGKANIATATGDK